MTKQKTALLAALLSIVGVLVVGAIAIAQQITWGQLKCIYSGKTKEECGIEPPPQTDDGDNKNTG